MSHPQKKNRVVFRMGSRIYLRAPEKKDIPKLVVWINDPEVTHFLKVDHPVTLEEEMKWIESIGEDKSRQHIVFAIVLEETDEVIGVMGLHQIDHKNGLAHTGSFIGRKDLWSKGYGTEAKMLVLEYAFNTLNLRKVCSAVIDYNLRSKRCLEKCGYKVEGTLKEHFYRDGHYRDKIVLAVFRSDFMAKWVELDCASWSKGK